MARFDVYANPGNHAKTTPYLLDAQSDLTNGFSARASVTTQLRRPARAGGEHAF